MSRSRSTPPRGRADVGAEVSLRQEIEFVERFVACYRPQFDALIDRLNEPGRSNRAVGDVQSLRLCVEAVNMLLATQGRLAAALRLATDRAVPAPCRAAA